MFIYIHPEDLYLYLQGEKINMKNNKKGFTLMEMLIVVAIIAVLVAIAIPVLNGTLEKAREATDAANLRAAYAELAVKVLNGEEGDGTTYIDVKDANGNVTGMKTDVEASQTQEDWQNTSITNIAGVDTKTGVNVSSKCIGWTVTVSNNGTVTFTEKTSS